MAQYTVKAGRRQITVRESLLDRAVRYFNPEAARRRMGARLGLEAATGTSGGYKGASKQRRALSAYLPGGGSADADLLPDLPVLRERSRDLVRNEPLAGGAINTVVTSVVGTGLALQAQVRADILGLDEQQAADWQAQAEREFELWAGSVECDAARTQNFYELQDLVFRATLESGDTFVLPPYIERPGSPYRLKLQVIEADRCANEVGKTGTSEIAGGVRCDSYGAPLAYYFLNEHPGNLRRKDRGGKWIEAFGAKSGRRQVLHVFKRLRPGQTRGEPYLAPVIELFKQLGNYTDAEVFAAVMSAFVAIKTVTPEGEGISNPLDSAIDGKTPGSSGDQARGGWNGELSPGLVVDLAPGEDFADHTPTRPNTGFDPFVQAILRQCGVRLELPFEVLVKHFTASYSAARAALLEAWKFYRSRRAWLAGQFCQPVYELFLEEAILRGRIAAPGFFADPLIRLAYCNAAWLGDGPGALDPMKEVSAIEKRIDIGLTSLKQEKAEYDGGDWEQTHQQRVKENEARKTAGLGAAKSPATPGGARPDDSEDKEDGTEADRRVSVTVNTPPVTIAAGAVQVAPPAVQVGGEVHHHHGRGKHIEKTVTARDERGLIKSLVEREVEDDTPGPK